MTRPLVIFSVLLLSMVPASSQSASQPDQREPELATLTAIPDKVIFKLGEPIYITLTLRAGPRGVFVEKWGIRNCTPAASEEGLHCPKPGSYSRSGNMSLQCLAAYQRDLDCGRHISNVSGFDAWAYMLDGKNASATGHGGVADGWGPPPSPKEIFEKGFMFLKSGQDVKWHNSVIDSPAKAGACQVIGWYIPDDPQLAAIAKLPEARGLVLTKAVQAPAIFVTVVQ